MLHGTDSQCLDKLLSMVSGAPKMCVLGGGRCSSGDKFT